MTNKPQGTLYVGVTSELAQRVWQHRDGVAKGFTKQYGLKQFVYFEEHPTIEAAIQREKNIKHRVRKWKIELVETKSPQWNDL